MFPMKSALCELQNLLQSVCIAISIAPPNNRNIFEVQMLEPIVPFNPANVKPATGTR
jgi:hypothetical protein